MKNVTITLREEVAAWARVWAARHGTSVSRMLGDLLESQMEQEQAYEAAKDTFLGQAPVVLREQGSYPPRGELYDRKSLR